MTTLWDYYDGVDELCEHLRQAGAYSWAESIAHAKLGGCTFGEILSNTGALIRSLAQSPDADVYGVAGEAGRLLADCDRLWNQANDGG